MPLNLDLETPNIHARRAINMAVRNVLLSLFTCCTTAAPLALPLTTLLHVVIVCSALVTLMFALRGLRQSRQTGQGMPEAVAALVVCAIQLSFNVGLAIIVLVVLNSSAVSITWLHQ
jgi:hypothetical protein